MPTLKPKEPAELSEVAWSLVNEAVDSGKMTLENGTQITLNADSLIRLIQWLATVKAKKPQHVTPPEDFKLMSTGGDDEEEA